MMMNLVDLCVWRFKGSWQLWLMYCCCFTMWRHLWESCTRYRSPRELITSCVCWSTSRPLVGRQHTLLTCSRLQGTFRHWLHCVPPRMATTLFRTPTVDLVTGLFQSCTSSLELAAGRLTWRLHCARQKCSNTAWKHFYLTVSTATDNILSFRIVMRHRSTCRGRITNACWHWHRHCCLLHIGAGADS